MAAEPVRLIDSSVISESALCGCLATAWGLVQARVTVHNGGMNSATWFVEDSGRRFVAKAVPAASRDQFVGGLSVAHRLQQGGIEAGAPVPTLDGRSVVDVAGHPLALLGFVPGQELTGEDNVSQRLIGATLARVHRALPAPKGDPSQFLWIDLRAEYLAIRDWVRPAVTAALAGLAELNLETLSWGMLHTDPAPEAFRLDPTTGICGIIDWSVALAGPRLYDLASAVMYVGGVDRGTELLAAYQSEQVLSQDEVRRGLRPMLTFRWAVQADYFARRIAVNDLTGIDGPAGNEKGLEDARRRLTAVLASDLGAKG